VQVLHLYPAGVPEDAHGSRQADGTRPGPHLSDAPHTVRHEVSQSSVKTRQKIPLGLLLYLWISASDPDPHWIQIQSGPWIRIQEFKSDPQKLKKFLKNSCFEALDVLFLWLKASTLVWTSFTEA
jgi:hypothetical protein